MDSTSMASDDSAAAGLLCRWRTTTGRRDSKISASGMSKTLARAMPMVCYERYWSGLRRRKCQLWTYPIIPIPQCGKKSTFNHAVANKLSVKQITDDFGRVWRIGGF